MGEDADGDGVTLEFIGGEWVFDPDDENGIDNDENGYIDDLIGWNFFLDSNDPMPMPGYPNNGHGTHCAGIAAGRTNNTEGIASIGWNLTLMPMVASDDENLGWGHYDALIYAAENGADIISNSWGSPVSIYAEIEVIEYVTGLGSILVGAAGNADSETLYYPACYPNVLSVASVNFDDTKTSYSSYGPSIDICAPGGGTGGGILSTLINGGYGRGYGTSMACPLVAGLLGLIKSYHPEWTNDLIIKQIIGTADSIDLQNPDYQYKLGSGRINASRALSNLAVVPEELKLYIENIHPQDDNGNDILEPGEEVSINIKFRNYAPCWGEDSVTITINTLDPEIIILNNSATVNIPPDNYFMVEDQFKIKVAEESTSHFAHFYVSIESQTPVVSFPNSTFKLLVAPSGIFVFEGEENGQDFSGTFIKNFLDTHGFECTYANTYPVSFKGFETVFLSHGNFGVNLNEGYFFTEEHSFICQEYLENGGNLYIEMGGMFTGSLFFNYASHTKMKLLFGVIDNALVAVNNPITSLVGSPGSLFEGISFSGSEQLYNWYIDQLEPYTVATIPFYENDYGNVSIMYDGSSTYGHKAFYFSYALAELEDGDYPNTREEVLRRICGFFDMFDPLADLMADTTFVFEGDSVLFTDLSSYPDNWEWQFEGGTPESSTEQNPTIVYNDFGIYDVRLIVTNEFGSDTLSVPDYITVSGGVGIAPLNSGEIQIYPNPARGISDIRYQISDIRFVLLEVLDIHGQRIKTLLNEQQGPGEYFVRFDGSDLPAGIYLIRLQAGSRIETAKIIVMR